MPSDLWNQIRGNGIRNRDQEGKLRGWRAKIDFYLRQRFPFRYFLDEAMRGIDGNIETIVQYKDQPIHEGTEMDIVIDTSAVIAVLVGEPEKPDIVKLTKGHTLIGPGSIPWEVGNAFSAMFRQNRIPLRDALRGVETFRKIPLRLVEADFPTVLDISFKYKIYAYDSFFLDCAIRLKAPLLTLDARLLQIATKIGLRTLEV